MQVETKDIPIGKITEEQFVHIFGSAKQIAAWDEGRKFKSASPRKTILKNARTKCNIIENKDGTYVIRRVYNRPIPANFDKMNTSLYKYIIPLICRRLTDNTEEDETRIVDLTIGHWAREIRMINSNYISGKYNKRDLMHLAEIEMPYIEDFYTHADEMIHYYMRNALELMKSAGLIIWDEPMYIIYDRSKCEKDWDGNVIIDSDIETKVATNEEMTLISECTKEADKQLQIESNSERYFGKKAKTWNNILHELLWKHNVKGFYKSYRIAVVHKDKVLNLIKHFNINSVSWCVSFLTREFSERVVNNADKRFASIKDQEDFIATTQLFYHDMFSKLCDITINEKAKELPIKDPEIEVKKGYITDELQSESASSN